MCACIYFMPISVCNLFSGSNLIEQYKKCICLLSGTTAASFGSEEQGKILDRYNDAERVFRYMNSKIDRQKNFSEPVFLNLKAKITKLQPSFRSLPSNTGHGNCTPSHRENCSDERIFLNRPKKYDLLNRPSKYDLLSPRSNESFLPDYNSKTERRRQHNTNSKLRRRDFRAVQNYVHNGKIRDLFSRISRVENRATRNGLLNKRIGGAQFKSEAARRFRKRDIFVRGSKPLEGYGGKNASQTQTFQRLPNPLPNVQLSNQGGAVSEGVYIIIFFFHYY